MHLPVFWVLKSLHFLCNLGAENPSTAPETSESQEPGGEEAVSFIPLAICIYLSLVFLPRLIIAIFRWRTRGSDIDLPKS